MFSVECARDSTSPMFEALLVVAKHAWSNTVLISVAL